MQHLHNFRKVSCWFYIISSRIKLNAASWHGNLHKVLVGPPSDISPACYYYTVLALDSAHVVISNQWCIY